MIEYPVNNKEGRHLYELVLQFDRRVLPVVMSHARGLNPILQIVRQNSFLILSDFSRSCKYLKTHFVN